MDPTSLSSLLDETGVTFTSNGLIVVIQHSWILAGENRLSYTTLLRLIECCREHHWNTDIMPEAKDRSIDSITRSISGSFIRPIIVGDTISITYRVVEIRRRAYIL